MFGQHDIDQAFLAELPGLVKHRLEVVKQQAKMQCLERWQEGLREQCYKKVYSFVTEKKYATLAGIKDEKGMTPKTTQGTVQALLAHWRRIFRHEPETNMDTLCAILEARYARFAIKPQCVKDVTAKDLVNAVQRMKSSGAPGPGGWRATEMKSLPEQA